MGADLWEMFEDGKADDEVAAIIRLGHSTVLPKGVRVVTQFGEIITVRMSRGSIPAVSGAPEVTAMVAGDAYVGPDIELDSAEIGDSSSQALLPTDERRPKELTATGKGVVIGIVDWGFDFTHPDFLNKDGSTRLLALWDQRGGRRPNSPEPFGYGVVHDSAAINLALKQKDPFAALQYHPADADTGIGCHGTHVASIAGGSGGEGRPTGIAPEAHFVLVHNSPWDELESNKLGDSVTLLEGIDFIAKTAGDRSWVINLSMGRHGEQHDGSTLIEQGLDAAIRLAPGRAVSLSAGNYFDKRIHASGQLRPTQERTLAWEITEGKPTYNLLEFWYSWQDKFEVAVRSPDGSIVARARIGERAKFLAGGKEIGNIYHRAQEPNNLDNHISIFLYKEAPEGKWEVTLSGVDVIDGRYHAWIERDVSCPRCQSRFHADDADPRSTTGTICNGRRTLAVGAYDAHDPEMRLGHFSSVGPTRDGRLKPDLCAPGVRVLAARSAPREKTADDAPLLTRMSGTSMAAPHVTGTIALMFQMAPRRLRIEETHNLLLESARRVSVPEAIPDRIGIGFLDVVEAVELARKVAPADGPFKQITVQALPTSKTPPPPAAKGAWRESTDAEFALGTQNREFGGETETEYEGVAFDQEQNTFASAARNIPSEIEIERSASIMEAMPQLDMDFERTTQAQHPDCACRHAREIEQDLEAAEQEKTGWEMETGESLVTGHDLESEWEGGVTVESEALFSESLAEDIIPSGNCSVGNFNCDNPPESDKKLIRPKGRPEGNFIDRTQGDPKANLALQLTDYDINAYLISKPRHQEALTRIREFIVDRAVQTKEDIAVTVTGSASRTGGKAYNDALSCKRSLCAANNLKTSLGFFSTVLNRVRINSAGDGFTRAACNGGDCELGEWRSVLIQVHAPNNPPEPLPVVDPGWDKYTIRCCEFHSELLLSALLGDLLNKALPDIPDNLKGPIIQGIKEGLKRLKEILGKAAPKLQVLFEDLTEFIKLFPAELIREHGTFEVRERDNPNPRVAVFCYSSVFGLRILFPIDKLDSLIDDAMEKIPGMKALPASVKKQIRDEIKKVIPNFIKTLAQRIESSTSGPLARFNLEHPGKIDVFGGAVQIGKGIWMPGRVNVQFASPPWGVPDPQKKPRIKTPCPDTECTDGGIQTLVGDGRGLELFSISAGDFTRGSCICAAPASAAREAERLETEHLFGNPAELVEVAEQIVSRVGRPAPHFVLHEIFEQAGRGGALTDRHASGKLSAAEIFDSFAYPGRPALLSQLEGSFEVVALPGAPLNCQLQKADILVRRGEGRAGHVSLIASPGLRKMEALFAEGLTPESFADGNYAQVIESGPFPCVSSDGFARLVTGPTGRVPSDSLVLRLRQTSADTENEGATPDFSERGSRLLDDLLLIKLATPAPQPVVITQPAAVTAKEPAATSDASATEDEVGCTHIDASQLSWPTATPDQRDFMRRVYLRQVRAACQSHAFVGDVPDSELASAGDGQRARTAAADSCRRLLAAAKTAIESDSSAAHVQRIGAASGYRSASQQMHNWNRNFPRYFRETSADRTGLESGEFGSAAEMLLTRYISVRLAAPGFSLHNNGLAIDFSAQEAGVSMGPSTTAQSRKHWRSSWFFRWLSDNAAGYSYFQNTSIDEPWHWEYRASSPSPQSVDFEDLREVQFLPDTSESFMREASELSVPGELILAADRLEVKHTPLLANHRGTQPDLILRWNDMTNPVGIDVVVHLHGFSEDRDSMRLRNKEAFSGLDFSNPIDKSGATHGRTQPTLCVLPRGSYVGDYPGVKDKRTYVFPALVTSKGLENLLEYSLDKFRATTGIDTSVARNRLILTAHSGGGLPLLKILSLNYVPDEIQVFDALYWDATPLIKWVQKRIANEIKLWTRGKQHAEGGLCVFYRTKHGTGTQSILVQKAIDAAITAAPAEASQILHASYRVVKTAVDHNEIPRKFGWLLLADISQTLPDVAPPEDSESFALESLDAEAVPVRSDAAYIRWVQRSLNDLERANLKIDGVNGPLTKAATRRFQSHHPPLKTDGIVGPKTEAALQAAGAEPPPDSGGGPGPGPGPLPSTVDARVDVSAQQALQRMLRGEPDARTDAAGMLAAVKSGKLTGIYGDDLAVSAQLARRHSKENWDLVPAGEDAALVLDPDESFSKPPTVVFRGDDGHTIPGGVRGNPARLDPALRKAYASFLLWESGALSVCSAPGVASRESGIMEQAPAPTVTNVVPATCSLHQPVPPPPAATRIISKWIGVDRSDIPKTMSAGHSVADTNWMGDLIDNSNIRFTGAYVTGPALSGQPGSSFTPASKAVARQWMPNIHALYDQGWGLAYFYVGYSVGGGAAAPSVGVDRIRGVLHGKHLRTILNALGPEVAGSVVFIDNEDSTSTTLPNNLLEYYDGLFDEMSRPDHDLAAFRPGLYGHGTPVTQLLSRRNDLFIWDVWLNTTTTTTPTPPFDVTDDPIHVDPILRPLKPYSVSSTRPSPRNWSLGRQFWFYTGPMPATHSAVATRLPAWRRLPTWDYDASFVRDPAFPFAEPRVQARRRGTDWLAVAGFFEPRTATPTPPKSRLTTQSSTISRALPVAQNVFAEPDAPIHLFDLGNDFVVATVLTTGTIGISRINAAGQWSAIDQITGSVAPLRRLRALAGVSRSATEAYLFSVGSDDTLSVKRLQGSPPWSNSQAVNNDLRLHPFSNLAVGARAGQTVDTFFIDDQGLLTTAYRAGSATTRWPGFQVQRLETSPSLLPGGSLAATSPQADHLLVFGISSQMRLAFSFFVNRRGWSAVSPAGQAQDWIGPHSRLAAHAISSTEVEVAALTDGGQLVIYSFRWDGANWIAGAREIAPDPPALSGTLPPAVGTAPQPANGFRINPFSDLSIIRLPDQTCSKVFCAGLRNGESKTLVCELGARNPWRYFI